MGKAKLDDVITMKLEIKENAHGHELKRLQNKFANLLPNINEAKDRYNLVVNARKARIADIEAKAILEVKQTDEFTSTKSTVQSKVLNALVRNYKYMTYYQKTLDEDTIAEVEGEYVHTSLSDEEHMLSLDLYRYNRARSRADELIQMLWVCRSGLSYDKEDMIHSSST